MNKEREKMVYRVEEIKTDNAIRFIKYCIAPIILIVAFFTHFFLPTVEVEVVQANNIVLNYELKINQYKDSIILASNLYNHGNISEANFFNDNKKYNDFLQINLLMLDEAVISQIAIKKEKSVFGFPSRHKFIWSLGLGIIISLLSIKIINNSHYIQEKNKRVADAIYGGIGGMVGGYMFSWIFYPENDLPYAYYMSIIVCLGILASVLGYFLSKSNYNNVSALKEKLRYSMKIIVLKIRKNGHVIDDDRYIKDIVSPAVDKYDE